MKKKSQKLNDLPKGAILISDIGSDRNRKSGRDADDRFVSSGDSVREELDTRGFNASYIPAFGPIRRRRRGMIKSWQLGHEAFVKCGAVRDANYWSEMLRSDEKGAVRELDDLFLESLKHLYKEKADWVVFLLLEAQSDLPGAMDELLDRIRHAVLFQDHTDESVPFIERVAKGKRLLQTKIRRNTRAEDRFRATFFCLDILWKKFLDEPPSEIGEDWLINNLPLRKEVVTFLHKVGKKSKDDPDGKHDADLFSGPVLSLCVTERPWGNSPVK